ncbi:Sperm associated antigen 1 [Mactra antiquata]
MGTNIMQGSTKKYDIPLDHLEFSYINGCSDVKELERIFKVLKSKEEGYYPDLEKCCEDRLETINPNSRLLRKESHLMSKTELERNEKDELDQDLKSWSSDMKYMETAFQPSDGLTGNDDDDELPPIRSGTITLTSDGAKSSKPTKTNPNKRVTPRDYREWDKIDVDKELEKVDEDDTKSKERTFVANKEVVNLPDQIDSKGLTDGEKLLKANREKDKGNEAFRSNDFKEAITYYSRSISLQPTAASYNNRALAYLKTKDWHGAVSDTNIVLSMEPQNLKALLRRGTAYKGLNQFDRAQADIELVLSKESNNKKAQELLEEIEAGRKEKKKKGRRMVIEDVDGETEDTNNVSEDSTVNVNKDIEVGGEEKKENGTETSAKVPVQNTSTPRRMQIEEVEEDDDDNDADNGSDNGDDNGGNDSDSKNDVVESNDNVQKEQKTNGVASNGLVEKEQSEVNAVKDNNVENEKTDGIKLDLNPVSDVESTEKSSKSTESSPREVENDSQKSDSDIAVTDESSDKDSPRSDSSESSFVKMRPVFYMKEMPKKAASVKEEATVLFKNGQYGEACKKYDEVVTLLEKERDQTVNLSLMYSNRAACHLKTGDLPGVVKDCNRSLELIPHSVKPLLRRATAYEHLERFRPAYIDYRHVISLDTRMEQAHLGIKRCQQILNQNDGPGWREKCKLTKFSPYDIPDIIGLDGKSTSQQVMPTSQQVPPISQQAPPASQQGPPSIPPINQSATSSVNNSQSDASKSVKSPENTVPVSNEKKVIKKTPQEEFEEMKLEGNNFVKNSKFKEAVTCYNKCNDILPGQVAIYTNRALCYLRLNEATKAECDCNEALTIEKDNVKALFRRAQARKMLKRYRDSLEDLKHLLQIDGKNTAAQKEMDIVKNYWREELEGMKKNLNNLKEKKEDTSAQINSSSSSNVGKQRKRMVIQEVDGSDEESSKKDVPKSKQQTASSTKDAKPKVEVLKSETNKPKQVKKTAEVSVKDAQPVKSQSKQNKESRQQKKSTLKETSTGLPRAATNVPKLDKATPYEFISAWNALKKSDTLLPYYNLLKQIKPSEIKTVISNKLDGDMLSVITRCVSEHYLQNGETDTGYEILKNLSTVPRFGTISMMMGRSDKKGVQSLLDKLESKPSQIYSADDIKKLRKEYSV